MELIAIVTNDYIKTKTEKTNKCDAVVHVIFLKVRVNAENSNDLCGTAVNPNNGGIKRLEPILS